MTHAELVKRAHAWLRNTVGCNPVFAELVTTSEVPDAIGWKYGYYSVLVECKANRADFLRDKNKFFRRAPEYGMGDYRYYLTVPGVIAVDELPPGWGLVHIVRGKALIQRHSSIDGTKPFGFVSGNPPFAGNKHREMKVLISALRRCGLRWDLSEIQKPLPKDRYVEKRR